MSSIRRFSTTLAFAAVLSTGLAFGQAPADDDPGITQTVARVSYLDGEVSYARGDDPDNWQPADRNVPMTIGDRVYTGGDSRAELQLPGGDAVRLAPGSDLTALNLTDDTRQFALKSGIAFFRVPNLESNEVFEVDSPNAAVTFERSGEYRIDVDADGNTRVSVHQGSASIAAGGGQVSVGADAGIRIDGIDAPRYEVIALPAVDTWDRWAGERESRALRAPSRQYVSAQVAGAEDLDEFGRWTRIPQYGMVWSPTSVSAGWEPYRAGRWMWQEPWGWTWVSTEPWGWAPYHSGRWVFASSRWCWVPVAPSVRVAYAPALVAFVGGGPGFPGAVAVGGGGFVGWFPLAPRDPLIPWWGRQDSVRVTQVTNITYVNRTYVTVVNQNTFVSGRPVAAGMITERTVVQQAVAAPVLRGPMPVAPTLASTRVSASSQATAPRPVAAVAARPVVARVAPPPAPARFDASLAISRQAGHAPVAVQSQTQAASAVRPAAGVDGKVTLAPRGGSAQSTPQRVEPIAPAKGRTLATASSPVSNNPAPAGNVPKAAPPASAAQEQPVPVRPAVEERKPAGVQNRPVTPARQQDFHQPDGRPARDNSADAGRRSGAPPTPRPEQVQNSGKPAPERAIHPVPTPYVARQGEPQHRAPAPGHDQGQPVARPTAERPHPAPPPQPASANRPNQPKEQEKEKSGNPKEKPTEKSKAHPPPRPTPAGEPKGGNS
ncbi:MAG TPA: DUF6600 domain-containing protein [Thermoanaerobaculia bacterium]|jgi:hypothetical protein|nr:DUF6600 domain-containing protein [Thermoanaerobaculia bacterium]